MGKFVKLMWFGTRATVAGGAVYALNEQRVWSADLDTSAVYAKVSDAVPAEVKDFSGQYITAYLPSREFFQLDGRQHWNNGVMGACGFLGDLPQHCSSAASYASDSASQLMQSLSADSSTEAVASPSKPQ